MPKPRRRLRGGWRSVEVKDVRRKSLGSGVCAKRGFFQRAYWPNARRETRMHAAQDGLRTPARGGHLLRFLKLRPKRCVISCETTCSRDLTQGRCIFLRTPNLGPVATSSILLSKPKPQGRSARAPRRSARRKNGRRKRDRRPTMTAKTASARKNSTHYLTSATAFPYEIHHPWKRAT